MCNKYVQAEENKEFIEKANEYYSNILKTKTINMQINKYIKILAGKNQGKKMIREVMLFHFPIIAYLKFCTIKK